MRLDPKNPKWEDRDRLLLSKGHACSVLYAALGDGGVPELAQAIRAFGNATEYVPAAMVGIAVLAMVEAPPLAVHLTGLLLFVGRGLHAFGLSRSGGSSFARSIGVTLTWLAYVFASVALLFYAIT